MRIRNLALVMQDFLALCKEAVGCYDCLVLVRLCLGTFLKCNKKAIFRDIATDSSGFCWDHCLLVGGFPGLSCRDWGCRVDLVWKAGGYGGYGVGFEGV